MRGGAPPAWWPPWRRCMRRARFTGWGPAAALLAMPLHCTVLYTGVGSLSRAEMPFVVEASVMGFYKVFVTHPNISFPCRSIYNTSLLPQTFVSLTTAGPEAGEPAGRRRRLHQGCRLWLRKAHRRWADLHRLRHARVPGEPPALGRIGLHSCQHFLAHGSQTLDPCERGGRCSRDGCRCGGVASKLCERFRLSHRRQRCCSGAAPASAWTGGASACCCTSCWSGNRPSSRRVTTGAQTAPQHLSSATPRQIF